jgi:predicted nucleotide-binding protein
MREDVIDDVIDEAIESADISSRLDVMAGGGADAREQLANDLRNALLDAKPELQRVVEAQRVDVDTAWKDLEQARHRYMLEHYPEYRQLDELLNQKIAEAKEKELHARQSQEHKSRERARLFAERMGNGEQEEPRRAPWWRRSRGGSTRSASRALEALDYDYARQLDELQRIQRAIQEIATERKRLELHVMARVERKDPDLAALSERERVARGNLHKALLENAVLPHAHAWIEEQPVNQRLLDDDPVEDERKDSEMAAPEERTETTPLATVGDNSLAAAAGAPGPGDHRSVFLVHGRDMRIARAMRDLLRSLGLRVVDWERAVSQTGQASPFTGDVVLAGMRMADAVLVLLTPDDMVQLRPDLLHDLDRDDEREVRGQARPNVIYEAGIADALDRSRTLLVEIGRVKSPSDISGRNVIRFDGEAASRDRLVSRLRNAGLIVDRSEDWLGAGDFGTPIRDAQNAMGGTSLG